LARQQNGFCDRALKPRAGACGSRTKEGKGKRNCRRRTKEEAESKVKNT